MTEPAGGTYAQYTHDIGGRLKRVNHSTGGVTQTRLFLYDNRGFLNQECHPEKGAGNTCAGASPFYVQHSNYDAMGNPGITVDGPSTVSRRFDRASRPTYVFDNLGRTLKSWVYSSWNSGSDLSRGKVVSATRHTYVTTPTTQSVRVITKYEYRDLAGRTSMKRQEIRVGTNPFGDDFETYYTWDAQGNIASIDYPRCVHYECQKDPGVAPDLQVNYNRDLGFLSSVTGSLNGSPKTFASSIWHHPNGMMARLVHGNGMVETWAIPANDMRRPDSITTTYPNGTTAWQTGEIDYDGAGNIQQIGTARFWYDGVQRLVGSKQPTDRQTAASANQTRAYEWDAYGNRTQAIRNGLGENLPISAATNRLNGPNALYDTAGNLTRSPAATIDKSTIYDYDPFHLMTYQKTPEGHEWIHIYDVDDERFWSVQWRPALGYSRWSLRGLDGKLLTEYEQEWINDGSEQRYQPPKDYIYREGSLLATWDHGEANQPYAQHLDHLGSPRLITNNLAQEVGWTVFDPFGEELVTTAPQTERMRFTGHERDYINAAGPQDDIDSMHARYCSPRWGRFLRVDPAQSWELGMPQSWNRYAYALGNPVKYVDPDGQEAVTFSGAMIYVAGPALEALAVAAVPVAALGVSGYLIYNAVDDPASLTHSGFSDALANVILHATGNSEAAGEGGEVQAGEQGGARAQSDGKGEFGRGGPPRQSGTGEYLPDPEATGPHSTLGTRTGSDGVPYRQGATFGSGGQFKGRTDVTNHGRGDHPNPHFHPATSPAGANSPAQPAPPKELRETPR